MYKLKYFILKQFNIIDDKYDCMTINDLKESITNFGYAKLSTIYRYYIKGLELCFCDISPMSSYKYSYITYYMKYRKFIEFVISHDKNITIRMKHSTIRYRILSNYLYITIGLFRTYIYGPDFIRI